MLRIALYIMLFLALIAGESMAARDFVKTDSWGTEDQGYGASSQGAQSQSTGGATLPVERVIKITEEEEFFYDKDTNDDMKFLDWSLDEDVKGVDPDKYSRDY